MPYALAYAGRPVKRMRQDGGHRIRLTYVSPEKGKPGAQDTVSQADWNLHGKKEWYASGKMPDQRSAAARWADGKVSSGFQTGEESWFDKMIAGIARLLTRC